MWDTGQTSISPITNGTQSSAIEYMKTNLTTGVTHYWRIKFWDNNGAEGSWSLISTFMKLGGFNNIQNHNYLV